jgi:hypothetical protein
MALGRAYSLGCAFIAGWFVMISGSTASAKLDLGGVAEGHGKDLGSQAYHDRGR